MNLVNTTLIATGMIASANYPLISETVENNQAPKKNVLFLLTDDMRFNTISGLGNKEILTPNLDKLVRDGIVFNNAYIEGGTHCAVCMPSRGMINTGKYLYKLKDSGNYITSEYALMCETFKNNGYLTWETGKWHNGADAFRRSFCDAKEIFFGGMADHWNIPACDFHADGNYPITPIVNQIHVSNATKNRRAEHINCGVHSTDIFANTTIDFLTNRDKSKPFFAYVSFMAPHDPRVVPQKYLDLYDNIEIPLPKNFMGGHPFDNGELHIRDEELAQFPRNPIEIKRHLKEYYAMITHIDDRVGDIIATLKKNGEYENTIIVFTGDNGLALGSHGLMGKQNLYDHSVRVPLIFAGPNIPKGKISNQYIYLTDLFATLCGLNCLEIPENIDSNDFSKVVLDKEDKIIREYIYCGYRDVQRSIRDQEFKLIEYVINGKHTETQLYNVNKDPDELCNLADNKAYVSTIEKLRKQMKIEAKVHGDFDHELGKVFWNGFEK